MANDKPYTLNATSASLLGFLHERPMTGWDIHVVANERIGKFWSITKSQVYRELISLASAGYISVGEKGSRMKQPYAITRNGKKAFARWIQTIDDTETIRIPMLLAVSFSRFMEPAALRRILQENLDSHTKKLHDYNVLLSSLPETKVAADGRRTLSFGIRYETMFIEWIQETLTSYEVSQHD